MKRELLTFVFYLTMACALPGCSEQTEVTPPSIYYCAVPASLEAGVDTGLAAISAEKPLPSDLRDGVVTAVKGISERNVTRSKEQVWTIMRAGDGAIPVIAELLASQDDVLRLKAIAALGTFRPLIPGPKKGDELAKTDPLIILLCRRSLCDRNVDVRREALGILGRIWSLHPKGALPEGLMAGLEQALKDPDAKMRERARRRMNRVRGTPVDPSRGVP